MASLEFAKNKMTLNYRVDWQTPDKYLDAARAVLGEIDLDPGSNDRANERVRAKQIYTRHDSCLEHVWQGKVWMNPAYTILPEMTERIISSYLAGTVPEALFMTHTKTVWDKWFQDAFRACDAVCFVNELVEWFPGHLVDLERSHLGINFAGPTYDERGTVIFYFGKNIDKFKEHFIQFGAIR